MQHHKKGSETSYTKVGRRAESKWHSYNQISDILPVQREVRAFNKHPFFNRWRFIKGKIYKLSGVYSEPARDPRGHFVSVCFIVLPEGEPRAGSDAKMVELFGLDALPKLAFDHEKIIKDAEGDLRGILSGM